MLHFNGLVELEKWLMKVFLRMCSACALLFGASVYCRHPESVEEWRSRRRPRWRKYSNVKGHYLPLTSSQSSCLPVFAPIWGSPQVKPYKCRFWDEDIFPMCAWLLYLFIFCVWTPSLENIFICVWSNSWLSIWFIRLSSHGYSQCEGL